MLSAQGLEQLLSVANTPCVLYTKNGSMVASNSPTIHYPATAADCGTCKTSPQNCDYRLAMQIAGLGSVLFEIYDKCATNELLSMLAEISTESQAKSQTSSKLPQSGESLGSEMTEASTFSLLLELLRRKTAQQKANEGKEYHLDSIQFQLERGYLYMTRVYINNSIIKIEEGTSLILALLGGQNAMPGYLKEMGVNRFAKLKMQDCSSLGSLVHTVNRHLSFQSYGNVEARSIAAQSETDKHASNSQGKAFNTQASNTQALASNTQNYASNQLVVGSGLSNAISNYITTADKQSTVLGTKWRDEFEKKLNFHTQTASKWSEFFQINAKEDIKPALCIAKPNLPSGSAALYSRPLLNIGKQDFDKQFEMVEQMFRKQSLNQVPVDAAMACMDESCHGDFETIWKNVIQAQDAEKSEARKYFDDLTLEASKWAISMDEYHKGVPLQAYLGDYIFEPDNKFLNHQDPFSKGLEMLRNGDNFSDIALAFEAALQSDLRRQEAWTQLGIIQSCNEKEIPAIKALSEAISLGENDLSAVMALAVCYTNEGFDLASYTLLKRWIAQKYPLLVKQNLTTLNKTNIQIDSERDNVLQIFLKAARQTPEGSEIDTDVQVGLGIILFGSRDYIRAIDCFKTALSKRPNDFLLWNKLGAALANSGQSEKAISAYHEALALQPNFVRARYNLSVSCINIGCFKEAAQHLLNSLSLHQDSSISKNSVNISNTIWDTLRRVLIVGLNRSDLAEKATNGTSVSTIREALDL